MTGQDLNADLRAIDIALEALTPRTVIGVGHPMLIDGMTEAFLALVGALKGIDEALAELRRDDEEVA